MNHPPVKPMRAEEAYDWRAGRWSQSVGRSFVEWLGCPPGLRWLEIGCGAGALSRAILEKGEPGKLIGIDPSEADLAQTRQTLRDGRAEFQQGVMEALPFPDRSFDVIAAGLVFNFLKDAPLAFREMQRVANPGGCLAGYVWDFAGEMQVVRRFWDAAIAVDGAAAFADQAAIFPFCRPEQLRQLFIDSGLHNVDVQPISATAQFPDFTTYWAALMAEDWTGGRFVNGLSEIAQQAIRKRLYESLPLRDDGSFVLLTRAWAARGTTADG
jgi:ubiquinone/menaquinone biosynthesis C-methylase UbiE